MKLTTPPKSPLLITALQLGLLLFFIYATFIGGQTAQGIFDHRWRLISLWLTAGLGGGWLLWKFIRGWPLPRTPFDGPLLFLTGAWLLASLFSLNPLYSREAFVFFIIYLLFFYLAVEAGRSPWLMELTLNAIIGVSGMVWMLALVQLSGWVQAPIAAGPPRLSVLGNPNTMASYIGLVLPLVLYKLVSGRSWFGRVLLAGWLVMLTGAILLTGSRGGVLGLAMAGLFFWLGWLRRKNPAAISGPVLGRSRLGLALILTGAVAGLIGLALFSRGLQSGLSVRQQVMSGALKTIAAHPLLGAGPGALGEAMLRYQQPLSLIWSDAHNIILTLIAETGLVGALGLVWLGWVSQKLLRSTWRGQATGWPLLSLSCAAALLGFLVHNQVDSMFKFPLIMVHVAILAGFWVSPIGVTGSRSAGHARLVVGLAGLVLLLTLGGGMRGVKNIRAYNEAVAAANQGDWPQALAHLAEAERLAPAMPFYQRQQGLLAGYLAAGDPAYRPQAIAAYEAALGQVAPVAVDQANLACLYWADDRPEAALTAMGRAVALAPGEPRYQLNLGYYLEQTGSIAAAEAAYAEVLRLQPAAAQASFWTETPDRAALWPAILDQTR
ncbi:MAG: O-antigen ligase family protein, partial [Anaerolineae bacterium]|nr:O-antigen ligase family protein [Anaerolineae bacterium]